VKFKLLYILPLVVLGIACDDSDDLNSNEKTISVQSFNSVDVDGNAVVRFDSDLSSSETIVIKGNPKHVGNVKIEVTNGTLVIRSADNVQLSDSLTIIVNPATLTSIKLEADQKAVVYWDGDHDYCFESIDIKTEANSTLGLFNICADNINIQQEAQSKVQLESWFSESIDTLAILETDVSVIEGDLYIIDNGYIIEADSVREVQKDGQYYLVFVGPEIRRYRVTNNVNAVLQATSELDADQLAVRNFDIKLEGESTASTWVLERLSGKGEGKTTLYYRGAPAIDYVTQGEAKIVNE
jgi:hypothetical protein